MSEEKVKIKQCPYCLREFVIKDRKDAQSWGGHKTLCKKRKFFNSFIYYDQIIELYEKGYNFAKIAKTLNISQTAVVNALKRAGLYKRIYKKSE